MSNPKKCNNGQIKFY
jgi:hypothetical protein